MVILAQPNENIIAYSKRSGKIQGLAAAVDFWHAYADGGQPDCPENNGGHDRARGGRHDAGKFYHCAEDGGRIAWPVPDAHIIPVFVQLLLAQGGVAACA